MPTYIVKIYLTEVVSLMNLLRLAMHVKLFVFESVNVHSKCNYHG